MPTERQKDQALAESMRAENLRRALGTGHLMIRRRLGESLVINGDTVVTVTEIRGGRVSLSILAPRHVEVWRDELVDPSTGFPPEVACVPG